MKRGYIGLFWPGNPEAPARWADETEFFLSMEHAKSVIERRVAHDRPKLPPNRVSWDERGLPQVIEATREWIIEGVMPGSRLYLHRIDGITYDLVRTQPGGIWTLTVSPTGRAQVARSTRKSTQV